MDSTSSAAVPSIVNALAAMLRAPGRPLVLALAPPPRARTVLVPEIVVAPVEFNVTVPLPVVVPIPAPPVAVTVLAVIPMVPPAVMDVVALPPSLKNPLPKGGAVPPVALTVVPAANVTLPPALMVIAPALLLPANVNGVTLTVEPAPRPTFPLVACKAMPLFNPSML